ncbi:hypothetical protein FQ010_24130 [Escherichia coli]|uniref:hypothetical protein n=1 Tax=Escherichia coli TaxID=562 RepID=UPI0013558AEA|nr:hypothetical protein [Escherichia coli]MXF13916.1 hypothetical protein [Escherichia coli]
MKIGNYQLSFQNETFNNISTLRMARMLSGNHSEAVFRGVRDLLFGSSDRDGELERLWQAIWPNKTGLDLQDGAILHALTEKQLDLQLEAFDRIRNASNSPEDFKIEVIAKPDNIYNGMITADVRFIVGGERLSHIQISAHDYNLPVPLSMGRFQKDYIDTKHVTCDIIQNDGRVFESFDISA